MISYFLLMERHTARAEQETSPLLSNSNPSPNMDTRGESSMTVQTDSVMKTLSSFNRSLYFNLFWKLFL